MKLKVIITGASGMVGEGVLLTALKSDKIESVLVIGRRHCGWTHPKLKEIIRNDFFNYDDIKDEITGFDTCFFCLGVSSVGMKEDEYKRITYDLTLSTAKALVERNPKMTFCYVSGAGTDSSEKGRLMWARVKGKTENDLFKLPFKDVYAFRPALMKPFKEQKNIKSIYKKFSFIYPIAKTMFSVFICDMEEVGASMINAALYGYPKKILDTKDIRLLALRSKK
ncbi:MAG: NAD-dependent epimerase/dehydratase family protein [Syntrophothermus sp.]